MAYSSINNNYETQLEHQRYIYSSEYKIDQFIDIAESRSFSYGYGCDGRNNGCKANRYDCSGIITQLLREVGTYSGKKLHTSTFHNIGKIIQSGIHRGDFAILLPDPKYQGRQHLVFIIEDLGRTIKVLDWVSSPGKPATTRLISKPIVKYFVRIDWMKNNKLSKFYTTK